MPEAKTAKKTTGTPTASTRTSAGAAFSTEERAAMKEYAEEKKRTARRGSKVTREDGEHDVLQAIAAMSEDDRAIAQRVHEIITAAAPELWPRTWYGMPAYAKDGNVICFFQNAGKFKARYQTLGFSDKAHLDDGNLWPTSYALTKLTRADEARIKALIKQAVS